MVVWWQNVSRIQHQFPTGLQNPFEEFDGVDVVPHPMEGVEGGDKADFRLVLRQEPLALSLVAGVQNQKT